MDLKYIVSVYVKGSPESGTSVTLTDEERAALLELQAGANDAEFVVDVDAGLAPADSESTQSSNSEGEEWEDGTTKVGDDLLRSLEAEVKALSTTAVEKDSSGNNRCPFCPFRAWPPSRSLSRLRKHVAEYHSARKQFIASGTKQLKLVLLALHDEDQCFR